MKRYTAAAILWIITLFLLSACNSTDEAGDLQRVMLEEVELLEIDHGSTTLYVETADVEALEVSLLRNTKSAGAVVDKKGERVRIHLDNDITRMLNIGKMPQLSVKIPANYEGKVLIDGSSGNVTGTGLQNHSFHVKGKSGEYLTCFPSFK